MPTKTKYVVGILEDLGNYRETYSKLQDITLYASKVRYEGPVIRNHNIDSLLKEAAATEFSYCLIQSVGHIIVDPAFFSLIDDWIDNFDFFITGHIIDMHFKNKRPHSGNKYYGLHKQCILVNLDYYRKFNSPEFGKKETENKTVHIPIRSNKDIHDDYTPVSLRPTEDTAVCTPMVEGWNFINRSIQENLTIYNFHPKIRVTKKFIYPSKDIVDLNNQLDNLVNILNHSGDSVFFWNTEKYYDIKHSENSIEPIDTLYAVAASFKPNYILHNFKFTDKTKVVFYDYSKQAIAYKNLMLKEWEGEDYPAFISYAKKKYPIKESSHDPFGNDNYQELWQKELSWWGGEKALKDHWMDYRELEHTFIHCNILENPEKLYRHINSNERSIIWWSNCFFTANAHYVRGLAELKELYKEWVDQLYSKNPNLLIFGRDELNNKIHGQFIADYRENYKC